MPYFSAFYNKTLTDKYCISRMKEWRVIDEVDVLIIEGILVFYNPEVRDMLNMKLFVDTDPDTRLSRRGE